MPQICHQPSCPDRNFSDEPEIQPDLVEAQYNLGWILLQMGQVDEAIAPFRTALRIQPAFARAHCALANALIRKGQTREAIAHCQQCLQIEPNQSSAQNGLAWILATAPDVSVRNGARAVELAQQANQFAVGRDPIVLRTLAAAYAEAGRFGEAVTTAQQALQLAAAWTNNVLAN